MRVIMSLLVLTLGPAFLDTYAAQADDNITLWLKADSSPCSHYSVTKPLHSLIARKLLKQPDPNPVRAGSLRVDTLKGAINLKKRRGSRKKYRSRIKRNSDHIYAVVHDNRGLRAKLTKNSHIHFDYLLCTYEYTDLKKATYWSLGDGWRGQERRAPYIKQIKRAPDKGSATFTVAKKKGAKRVSVIVIRGGFHDSKVRYSLQLKRR